MTFALEPITDTKARNAAGNSLGVYGGRWAVNHSINAHLYFIGNDIHDPGIPHSYVFSWGVRQCSVEVIDSANASENERQSHGRLFFVVVGGALTQDTQLELHLRELISEALKLLMGRPDSEYRFVHQFQAFAKPNMAFTLASQTKTSWGAYLDALLPLAFFLALGLLVLVLEASKH